MSDRRRLRKIVWKLPYPAIGKPRMTQQDKWKVRPCVDNYRTWCDLVRMCMRDVPRPGETYLIVIDARYAPPQKWPKARKLAMMGALKRTTPDPDNIAKAFLDCWWPDGDQAVGDLLVRRRWWDESETEITMWLDEEVLLDEQVAEPSV